MTRRHPKTTQNRADNISREIETAAASIRRKYSELRQREVSNEEDLIKKYQPIVQPLNNIIKNVVKTEGRPPPLPFTKVEKVEETDQQPFSLDNILRDGSATSRETIETYLNDEIGSVTRPFLRELIFETAASRRRKVFDKHYGIRKEGDVFSIGDSVVTFSANDYVHVKGDHYKMTAGLAQLLFLNEPEKYTKQDLAMYKRIVLATHANRKNYSLSDRIVGNKSVKYNQIVRSFALMKSAARVSGHGLMRVSGRPVDYVYFDDPNELVDRLYLLHSSRVAGHTGHENEIASLEEELRELHLIV